MTENKEVQIVCSFCGISSQDAHHIITSHKGVAICDECVMNCLNVIIYGNDDNDEAFEFELESNEEDENEEESGEN